jgi:hypothetical protein
MTRTTLKPQSGRKLFSLLLATVMILGVALPVAAQEKKERKTKQTVAMSQPVYEKLMEIQEFVEADDFSNAQAMIREIQEGKKKLSPYLTVS